MQCTILDIDLGPEVLLGFLNRPNGIEEWNHWVQAIAPLVTQGAGCLSEALIVGLDFSSSNLIGMDLDGIHLSLAWLEDVDFSRASLRGAKIGCPVRAVFRGADLAGAMICGDVTGTDFRGAYLDSISLEDCGYEQSSPPLGLPDHLLTQCKEDDVEPIKPSTRPNTASVAVRGRLILPQYSKPSCVATS